MTSEKGPENVLNLKPEQRLAPNIGLWEVRS